ncbi:mandelate racemase/muconate lactonizing enzyme family protein [Halieaceae bacterium IMCC8485]|uniref:Mandelate racemase/muconate lactonizing enzyme family protein n=1 Tax=Candidatus Seongchinamella marina TaxID=2518990 RepID=A0ABT3SY80_9GAMM|nr:mandelate racemase/muconate lactonizing enzyme family protein [Candidatus Seongchinamella marina]MCX2974961.1 mandelate racemase/muconate lactonizing enzyme family protein [Candidatus Seongchinamella marina]
MLIKEFETFVVANPPPRFGGRYFIFIKLVTDTGIVGYGEVYCATFSAHTVEAMLKDTAERFIIGHDPFHIEKLWRSVYGAGYTLRPDVSLVSVLSALEIACWDIVGKACEKPAYELLGGQVHDRLRSYTYIYPAQGDVYPEDGDEDHVYVNPESAAQRAMDYVAQGFTALKFDPAGPYTVFDGGMPSGEELDRSEAFIKAIREAVGGSVDLLFGTHGQFSPAGAIRLAKRLEAYDPLWFEEPIPPENTAAMAQVASATSIPVATGERLCTKYEFARVLQDRAASILQLNLGRVGGLLEAKKIAALAEVHYAQLAPHMYCGPIVGAANIQLATCSPNFLILEGIETWGGFQAELLEKPVQWQDGYIVPSREPGLGVSLNEAVARANPWTGNELHLQMGLEPVR